MSVWELISYTRQRIRGKRAELLFVCMPPIAAVLLFRLAEAAFYSILLYFGALSPAELFTAGHFGQFIIAALMTLLRWGIAAPLICAAAVKLRSIVGERAESINTSDFLLSGAFVGRSISAYLSVKILCFAAFLPSALLIMYSYTLLTNGGDSEELFAAWNAAALAFVFAALWLYVRISMTVVPFLLAEYPERKAMACVMMALGFMRGRKRLPVKLALTYILPIATVVGIPVFLPEFAAAFATGISIYIKEDEYARSALQRRVR